MFVYWLHTLPLNVFTKCVLFVVFEMFKFYAHPFAPHVYKFEIEIRYNITTVFFFFIINQPLESNRINAVFLI